MTDYTSSQDYMSKLRITNNYDYYAKRCMDLIPTYCNLKKKFDYNYTTPKCEYPHTHVFSHYSCYFEHET